MTYLCENITELYAFETEYTKELRNIPDAKNSSPLVPTLEELCKTGFATQFETSLEQAVLLTPIHANLPCFEIPYDQ